jgi:tetratricopeptide (TPR) repeat protein
VAVKKRDYRALLTQLWKDGSLARMAGAFAILLLAGLSPLPHALTDGLPQAHEAAIRRDWQTAAPIYRFAASYAPWAEGYLVAAAEASLEAGDYQEARDVLMMLRERRDLAPEEMLWLGEAYDHLGYPEQALSVWEEALAAGHASREVLARMAFLYRAQGDYPQATDALYRLAQYIPTDEAVLRELALLQALTDPEGARLRLGEILASEELAPLGDLLREADVLSPEDYYGQLGMIYIELEEWELAEAALARSVALDPAQAGRTAYLGYVRGRLGEPGLGALQQAMALAPENPLVFTLAGLYLERVGAWPEARVALEWAYNLDPRNPAVAVEIASTHRAQGAYAMAELWLQEAVRLAPDDPRFELVLAAFYLDEAYRMEEVGLPLARDLAAREPESAEAHAILGGMLLYSGDYEGAEAELQTALTLDPRSARANYTLAVLYETQGRPHEALQYYQAAVEETPDGRFGILSQRAIERLMGE